MKSDNLLVRKAEDLLLAGHFVKAQDLLTEAIENDPNNPEAYYLLGDVFCKLQRFKDAITVLQKADSLSPKHPRIYHLLGWAIFMNGDVPAGRAFMEAALNAEPDDIQILADLAVLEMKAGNFVKSQEYISKAKTIAPEDKMIAEIEIVTDMMERLSEQANKKSN